MTTVKRLLILFSQLTTFLGGSVILLAKLEACSAAAAKFKCNFKDYDKEVAVDCSRNHFPINVPQNFSTEITVLDLSYNRAEYIVDDSFERYSRLRVLNLSSCATDSEMVFFDLCFLPLNELRLLNLSYTCYPPERPARFPPSLEILYLAGCASLKTIDLSDLPAMTEFHAEMSQFEGLPKFHRNAPITEIDVRGSGLSQLRVRDLSPLCTLKRFYAVPTENSGLLLNYCECMKVGKWLEYTGTSHLPVRCVEPAKVDVDCDYREPDKEDVELRRACLTQRASERTQSYVWMLLAVIAVLALFCIASIFSFLFIRDVLPLMKKEREFEESTGETEEFTEEGAADESETVGDAES